nr:PREDICTED: insulin-like peptide receptor [Bemisia tabaci]XP_018916406.1 PREDICTED: insulin-like peptide receptor [Bemisia tabaci]
MGRCSPAEIPRDADVGCGGGVCAGASAGGPRPGGQGPCGCSRLAGPPEPEGEMGAGGRRSSHGRGNCYCAGVVGDDGVECDGGGGSGSGSGEWILREGREGDASASASASGSGARLRRVKAHRGGSGDDVSWSAWTLTWLWITVILLSTPLVAVNIKGVCQSIDIRNKIKHFDELKGCKVVEGFVQIVLIDEADSSQYDNISFPELREITGYLLLYRVKGLKTLSKMFPNLAVIRGQQLFFNYALVIFEMLDLQEVGLHSLTDILRGAVYIVKNPMLCYHDNIDWNVLSRNSSEGSHYIANNRIMNECPGCSASLTCPNRTNTKEPLCWDSDHCQKICPKCNGGSCLPNGSCCHERCLGGCEVENDMNRCFACRDVLYEGTCLETCPPYTYRFMNRRCISESECYNMPRPRESAEKRNHPWKPHQNECTLECPINYMEVKDPDRPERYKCVECKGICTKNCPGAIVDSVASAQKLRGCTRINGPLEIQIRGGMNVVKELEISLSSIEEIDEYLKIVRSFPLVSLNFLKKLRIIRGDRLESGKYALVLLDNQNLAELWDWSTKEAGRNGTGLTILKGRLFFHFNPKLCIDRIETLAKKVGIDTLDELDVAKASNGDKVACNMSTLNTWVKLIYPEAVVVEWGPEFHRQHHDPRTILSYVVYYTEAREGNVSLYDGRDACGNDGWMMDDTTDDYLLLLTGLKPFTRYAYFVKTYTIASETNGARSDITYFRTAAAQPSSPVNIKLKYVDSNSISLEWEAPPHPNGNVTSYEVIVNKALFALEQRDYCEKPISTDSKRTPQPDIDVAAPKATNEKNMCGVKEEKKGTQVDQNRALMEIELENYLQNTIYVRRPSRDKREVNSEDKGNHLESGPAKSVLMSKFDFKDSDGGTLPDKNDLVYHQKVNSTGKSTSLTIGNLKHYTDYNVHIRACREKDENDQLNSSLCSMDAVISVKTAGLPSADDLRNPVYEVKPANKSQTFVFLHWTDPPEPNGAIVSYHVEYRRTDVEALKITQCIPRKDFQNSTSPVRIVLYPGNYSMRIRADSLFGPGKYSEEININIKETGSVFMNIIISLLCVLVIVIGTGLCLRRKYGNDFPNSKLIASVNPEYVPTVYIADEWEVPRENIEILRELGQGSFGMVYEGIARDIVPNEPVKPCAVKTVNEFANGRDRHEFLNEASVMKAFNTHHVVRLLGVVTSGHPTLVVMELMRNGDLKTYLRSHRPADSKDLRSTASSTLLSQNSLMTPVPGPDHGKHPPTLKRTLRMAAEIADGMAFLAAKRFVHRDLAARNCMVAEDLTVKIGDFGMTREIYETDYYRKGTKGLLPVRWMAPESLKDGVFTSQSDVWSYGVVLWEMATLASQPYQGLANDQVLRYVRDGGIMERPDNCPDKLYEIMRLCWQYKPSIRPSFMELVKILLPDIDDDFSKLSFYHSDDANELRKSFNISNQDANESCPFEDKNESSTPLRISRSIEDFSLTSDDEDTAPPPQFEKTQVRVVIEDKTEPIPHPEPIDEDVDEGVDEGVFEGAFDGIGDSTATALEQHSLAGSSARIMNKARGKSNGSTTPTSNGCIFARQNGNTKSSTKNATQTTKC